MKTEEQYKKEFDEMYKIGYNAGYNQAVIDQTKRIIQSVKK